MFNCLAIIQNNYGNFYLKRTCLVVNIVKALSNHIIIWFMPDPVKTDKTSFILNSIIIQKDW